MMGQFLGKELTLVAKDFISQVSSTSSSSTGLLLFTGLLLCRPPVASSSSTYPLIGKTLRIVSVSRLRSPRLLSSSRSCSNFDKSQSQTHPFVYVSRSLGPVLVPKYRKSEKNCNGLIILFLSRSQDKKHETLGLIPVSFHF